MADVIQKDIKKPDSPAYYLGGIIVISSAIVGVSAGLLTFGLDLLAISVSAVGGAFVGAILAPNGNK